MADTAEFKAFLNRLRALGPDAFPTKAEIETAIVKFACEGCGKHCQPCRSCEDCVRYTSNENVQHCEMRCEDCFFCGCRKCSEGWEYDGYVDPPFYAARGRYNAIQAAVFNVAREINVPAKILIDVFGAFYVNPKFQTASYTAF